MAKYNFYRELRDDMGQLVRKSSGLSKKAARKLGADPVSAAMKMFFQLPNSGMTLDAAVLADEEDYIYHDRRVYIPQNKELVEMLWRSKMDVHLSDLAHFPSAFTVAWPKDTVIDGVQLPGCLVWFGTRHDRKRVAKLMEKWTGTPVDLSPRGKYTPVCDDEYSFHLVFPVGQGANAMYTRLSIPEVWLEECLKSSDEMENKLGSYGGVAMVLNLSPEERHIQYVTVKCILNLMVFATACPYAVLSGWPDDIGSSPNTKGREPTTLASPIQREHQGGTHASPEAHLRAGCDAYFRSYPTRKDGTKKKGIYLVSGHGWSMQKLTPRR